jgi:hypothetical protein
MDPIFILSIYDKDSNPNSITQSISNSLNDSFITLLNYLNSNIDPDLIEEFFNELPPHQQSSYFTDKHHFRTDLTFNQHFYSFLSSFISDFDSHLIVTINTLHNSTLSPTFTSLNRYY